MLLVLYFTDHSLMSSFPPELGEEMSSRDGHLVLGGGILHEEPQAPFNPGRLHDSFSMVLEANLLVYRHLYKTEGE